MFLGAHLTTSNLRFPAIHCNLFFALAKSFQKKRISIAIRGAGSYKNIFISILYLFLSLKEMFC